MSHTEIEYTQITNQNPILRLNKPKGEHYPLLDKIAWRTEDIEDPGSQFLCLSLSAQPLYGVLLAFFHFRLNSLSEISTFS